MKKTPSFIRMLALALTLAMLSPAAALADFADVSAGRAEYGAVKWALDNGVAFGVGDGNFHPEEPCTKAAFVTFLWRMCGAPDVSRGADWWSDAAAWAMAKGVLQDTDDLTEPLCARDMARILGTQEKTGAETVTRGEAVSALYAAASFGTLAFRRDISPDSGEFLTLQHEIYVRNQLDALLKRHGSVTFDLTDSPKNDYNLREYFYITREACYYESQSGACYEFDRVFYEIDYGGEGPSNLIYGLDLRSDYDLSEVAAYQFPPKDAEAKWFDSEIEEHVACCIADGLVYLRDRHNAGSSAAWFAEHLPFEVYDGEIVYDEVVADAQTLEITEFNYYLQSRDGTMTRVAHLTAAYDEPEPRRVSNMRSAFERYCENTIDATLVVDPGTEREFSKSFTIPVGSVINYRCDNLGGAITADDPDVTRLTHWDGMKSRTGYIITQPTEEQLARFNDLLTQLRAELAGQAAEG